MKHIAFLGGLVAAPACATTRASDSRPEAMSATEHLERARSHSEAAATTSSSVTGFGYGLGYGYGYGSHGWGGWSGWAHGGWSSPWYYYWDPAREHARLADAHRDAAEILKVAYQSSCTAVPDELRTVSPLAAYATSMERVASGVVFQLDPAAGPPEVVLARLRCHRGWLQLEPRADAGDEPLLIPSASWVTHAATASIEVMATVDAAVLPELERRAALTVERAKRNRDAKQSAR